MSNSRKRPETIVTRRPDPPPPQLMCPTCLRPLVYRETVMSGRPAPERWDYFACPRCGAFEYRHRTNRLKPIQS
jgi:hypothetical protein